MAKVITFSRSFPSDHPNAGERTFFVEKFLSAVGIDWTDESYFHWVVQNNPEVSEEELIAFLGSLNVFIGNKYHTLRTSDRFKAGDQFSPRVWSGKPYSSKMITFAPDTTIKSVQKIKLSIISPAFMAAFIDDKQIVTTRLAANDGLEYMAFYNWFKKGVEKATDGLTVYSICWNKQGIY